MRKLGCEQCYAVLRCTFRPHQHRKRELLTSVKITFYGIRIYNVRKLRSHSPKVLFFAKFAQSSRMIIISSGFPKSASTLLFLYTERLIVQSGRSRGQKMFRYLNKEGFTPWFGPFNSAWYVFLSMFGPIVIKTHAGPGFFLKILLRLGLAKAYYSIRDPRDVVLSALDHANKARGKLKMSASDKAFAPFRTIKDVVPALNMHLTRYKSWEKYGHVLFLRYEEVMLHPETELKKIVAHVNRLNWNPYVAETIDWFAKRKSETINFNKGTLSRYQTELSSEEIIEIEKDFKEVIVAMNYQLTAL